MGQKTTSLEKTTEVVRCQCGSAVNVYRKKIKKRGIFYFFDKYTKTLHRDDFSEEWEKVFFKCPCCENVIGEISKLWIEK